MRVDVVLRYVGVVMLFIALFMLLSAGISFVSGMDSAFYPLLLASLLTALLGAFPLIFVERTQQITNKEGFCIVVGSWLVACLVGMFPYLIWGGEFSLVNAWFESVSGFTTTGSTILNDIEVLPRGLQFWRMSSTWIGGMGVVMFALLILPSLGRNKMTLSSVELSTLAKDNYRYRTQIIVQILLVVYVGLTVLTTVLLKMAGMNWFDALCHAMSACATSGFSTKNASIAYFNSPMIDTILIFAMATAGIHFGLIYATVTGKRNNIFRSEVTRWYLVMLLGGGLLVDDRLVAMSLAENCGGTLIIHVEKALYSHQGAYPTLVQAFAAHFGGGCVYINREDDAGDRGLRTSKLQYLPVRLAGKLRFEVQCEADRLREIPTVTTPRLTLTPLEERDEAAYNALCLDDARNRWWGYDYRQDLKGELTEDYFLSVARRDFAARRAVNFAVRLDRQLIGEVVLYRFDWRGGAELGCRIDSAYAGHGYGAEAFAAAADWALFRLSLARVKAKCYKENAASYKMLSACMRPAGEDETFFYFEKTV